MRRAPFDNHSDAGAKSKDAEYRYSLNCIEHHQETNYLQRSVSADNVVIRSRGYKPSDRHDPVKRSFLENLTSKILHFDVMESGETTPINLQKLLTPASDSPVIMQSKNKKMFASSYFYAPTHPTVEDQVELARRISHSLSDVKNMKSKGQSMYVNRKKRSVKWIHDGNGIEDEEDTSTTMHKDKLPLKCVMNPNGKVLDIHGIQALGEEVNIESMPSHPEKLFDIVRDLNNQRGRGAEIFAKRRKRSEKWVVDRDTQPQTPSTPNVSKGTSMYPSKMETNGISGFSSQTAFAPVTPSSNLEKPFYNPFTVDLSLDIPNMPGTAKKQSRRSERLVKKIYLREVAVGTDSDFPANNLRSGPSNDSLPNAKRQTNKSQKPHKPKPTRSSHHTIATNTHSSRVRENGTMSRDNAFKAMNVISAKQAAPVAVGEENGYTSVPVKQLIQEFEKTCRPVLQYKQISAKVIPTVQPCLVDGGIARFFETNSSQTKRMETQRLREMNGKQEPKRFEQVEEDDDVDEEDDDSEEEDIRVPRRMEYDQSSRQAVEERQFHENNGYASIDESDYTTDETDTSAPMDSYGDDRMPYQLSYPTFYPSEMEQPGITNGVPREYSMYHEEYSRRRESITSQELETLYRNIEQNGDVRPDPKYVNTEADVPMQAKSLLLSMVASQENILETIKNLRSTPVLDNLLSGTSPDCNFADLYPEQVGKKLYESTPYSGPKIASVQNLINYNTAPRGWDQSFTVYRPIKFEKPQETMVYSDF